MTTFDQVVGLSDQLHALVKGRPRKIGIAALATCLALGLKGAPPDAPSDIRELQRILQQIVAEILARGAASES